MTRQQDAPFMHPDSPEEAAMHVIHIPAAVPLRRVGGAVPEETATTFAQWAKDRGYDKAIRDYERVGAS